MSEVKRCDPVVAEDCDPPFGMVPAMRNNTGGRFVHYMDYADLLARHDALVEAVKKMLAADDDLLGEQWSAERHKRLQTSYHEARAEVDRRIANESEK